MMQQQVNREYRSAEAVEAERDAALTPEKAFRDLYLAARAVQADGNGEPHRADLAKALTQSHAMLAQLGIDVPAPAA